VSLPLVSGLSSYYEFRELELAVFLVLGLTVFATLVKLGSAALEDHIFEILVWSVSLSLILSTASFSQYLWGWDIQREFAIFQQVSRTGVWNFGNDFIYNSSISISILPAMVQALTGLDGQDVFKFIYPLVFSIVPVVLYKIYRRFSSPKAAFLSVFLVMSYYPFYNELVHIGKQMIAELLMVLLLWILVSEVNEKSLGVVGALLLSVGLITSHYTLAYIWFAFVAFSLVTSRITRKVVAASTWVMVVVFGVMTLAWYAFVASGAALNTFVGWLSNVIQGITQDFFNPSTRPEEALQAAGLTAWTPGLLHELFRLTNYIVPLCIVVGFIAFVYKRKKSPAERKMLPLMTIALVFLVSAIILPSFEGIPFSRIYHLSLLFCSPCFVIGAELPIMWGRRACTSLSHYLPVFHLRFSSRGKIIAATILFSYFLFTSGWVWAASLDPKPTSIVLDSRRMAAEPVKTDYLYYQDVDLPTDVNGAFWLRSYGENGPRYCADYVSRFHVLYAYAEFDSSQSQLLRYCDLSKSYIFLSELNVLHAVGVDFQEPYGTPLFYQFSTNIFTNSSNRLYSNGGTAIYAGVKLS